MENEIKTEKFLNAEEGVEIILMGAKFEDGRPGFKVLIRDTDADQIVPYIVTYPKIEAARAAVEKAIARGGYISVVL